MKSTDKSNAFRPFENLRSLMKRHEISSHYPSPPKSPDNLPPKRHPPESDHHIFLKAMEGVAPIDRNNIVEKGVPSLTPVTKENEDAADRETIEKLKALIRSGEGFNISDTDEYIEGTGKNVAPQMATLLHQGKFSIQDHIDLHGLGVHDAKHALDLFLKKALSSGKKQVLIVHGRGLSSPNEPVLKRNVQKWLSTGYWKKRVIAFASARNYDGGAGGTYVLLKNQP